MFPRTFVQPAKLPKKCGIINTVDVVGRVGDIDSSGMAFEILYLIKSTECFFIRTKEFVFVCYGYRKEVDIEGKC